MFSYHVYDLWAINNYPDDSISSSSSLSSPVSVDLIRSRMDRLGRLSIFFDLIVIGWDLLPNMPPSLICSPAEYMFIRRSSYMTGVGMDNLASICQAKSRMILLKRRLLCRPILLLILFKRNDKTRTGDGVMDGDVVSSVVWPVSMAGRRDPERVNILQRGLFLVALPPSIPVDGV